MSQRSEHSEISEENSNKSQYYNLAVLKIIKETPRNKKKSLVSADQEYLGKGIWGKTYTGHLNCLPDYELVIKKLKRGTYTQNELHALIFLREKMLCEELPPCYNFMYGCYSKDKYQYFILEKCDEMLFEVMENKNFDLPWFKNVYNQIIDGVAALESFQINHGDLWDGNIMVNWDDDYNPHIIFIDWDSAFKPNSQFQTPTLGGGFVKKNRFILGYDLNRYFDSVLYNYNSYMVKREKMIKKLIKRKQNIIDHPDLEDIDNLNIIYPPEIIYFIQIVNAVDIDDVVNSTDLSHMAAEKIKNILLPISNS
jgi:serine/threonine protein kinase